MQRKTKIVATIGPACESRTQLKRLIEEGVNVVRINASHTNPAKLKQWIALIRKFNKTVDKPAAIMADLQGPRVRTGSLKGGKKLVLKKGMAVTITPSPKPGSGTSIMTSCKEFPKIVKKGDRILLDNGLIELHVTRLKGKVTFCKVVQPGVLGENKGINLPAAPIRLPALTPKDRRDLEVASKLGVDYVALSFVRTQEDVIKVKRWLAKRKRSIPIIAKIEKANAVGNISSILRVADGIMVARGDLAIEIGVEKVPVVQKQLIERANQSRVPVITATQMMESMMTQTHPTRAEASDIANAVFDGTDAVMLSGETAIGKYPLRCVRIMSSIIFWAERYLHRRSKNNGRKQC